MDRTVQFFNSVCSEVKEYSDKPSLPLITKSEFIDDCAEGQYPIANVFVAAHGGVVRMHLMYFESLRCRINASTTRATPNTALSSFLVSIDEDGKCCDVVCLRLHDDSHVIRQHN